MYTSLVLILFVIYIFFVSNIEVSDNIGLDIAGAVVVLVLAGCSIHLLTKIFAPDMYTLRRDVGKKIYIQVGASELRAHTIYNEASSKLLFRSSYPRLA